MHRLAVLTSHPIQYYGPLFRELAERLELHVFFAHRATPQDQARAGFGIAFDWDVDITSGYEHTFLKNVAVKPGSDRFGGSDTPEVGRHLGKGRFDALLVTGWNLKTYLQGVMAAKRAGLPVMVRGDSHLVTQRSLLKRTLKSIAYPRLLRVFDSALYVGVRSHDYYTHFGFPRDRLHFSPHCVDTRWFAERAAGDAGLEFRRGMGIAAGSHLVLFAGKLMDYKRPVDVIEASSLCRRRGTPVEVVVAGDGVLRDEVLAAARRLAVPMHFLGFCNQTRMPAVYAAVDCLVLPSDGRETWGLVANEALACGTPIVVSEECGCAADFIRPRTGDLQVGYSYPVGNIAALADIMGKILARPPTGAAMAAVCEAYSLSAAAEGVCGAMEFLKRCQR